MSAYQPEVKTSFSIGYSNPTLSINNLAAVFVGINQYIEPLTQILTACNTDIDNDSELESRHQLIEELYNCAETEDDLPALLADLITDRVFEYEQKTVEIPNIKPSEALSFFMQEHNVKQKDLSSVAPQNVISEILNEKRNMTVEQIKGFARFFNVPETMFLG